MYTHAILMIKLNNKSDTASKNYGIKAGIWGFHLCWSTVGKGRFHAELKQVAMPVENDGKGNDLLRMFLSNSVVVMGNYQIQSRPPLFPPKEKNSALAQLDMSLT